MISNTTANEARVKTRELKAILDRLYAEKEKGKKPSMVVGLLLERDIEDIASHEGLAP